MAGKKGLQAWVEDFARNVAAQTDEIMKPGGSARVGNKYAKKSWEAFEKLCAQGDAGRDALAALFTRARLDVRVSAAVHLLRHRTAEAKAVLQEAASGKGLVAFRAQEALKRWEEGTWALDPAPEK